MKFLIDAQLPPAFGHWLRARGHEAEHVATNGLVAASDVDIAARAAADGAILITKDEDFLMLRSRTASRCRGSGAATRPTGRSKPGSIRAGHRSRRCWRGASG